MTKSIPNGMLFPASIQNDTNLIFITSNNLSGVIKAILNYKTNDIIAEIDVSKIKNWKKIKGKSIWVNTQFKDHKEINNNNHLCFPFLTRLEGDQKKKIKFAGDKKKVIIFNFQIDIYLT